MHLAILMTNTDESEFAQVRPKDGEKFTRLINEVRPTWSCTTFSVKDGVFPKDIAQFDGVLITGSPASVGEGAEWIARLLELIREIDARKMPMFGACFGHQAIAVALGGAMERNMDGWVHGHVFVEQAPLPWGDNHPRVGLYASHIEQVTALPDGATAVASGPGCQIAGYVKGQHIYSTQYHPEMSDAFIADLVEHTADYVGAEVTQVAQASLANTADRAIFAEQIVQFFEWASE
ncbi:type 1 glutamine amidotransferase [Shimia abyssi]|uniref:GMP synthase-like glutamine amidotransferase n=1 Tax=Shimia abyssi TaxID=1662395 RepID=A0A2P8F840_9RHOB|nr:type 1 glutamine amidotransferase [Shimia abyssi]PSL17890.1 GMP synthase-like glutamine amidotransferase [Shimia abyssi]